MEPRLHALRALTKEKGRGMFHVIKGGRNGGPEHVADQRASAQRTDRVLAVIKLACQVVLVLAFVGVVLVLNSRFFSWADKQDQSLRKASVSTQAGAVLDVDLHPSLLFNTTTVRSTTGQIFQVKGAVSAGKGDGLVRKTREPGLLHRLDGDALCVQSKDSQACYPLL